MPFILTAVLCHQLLAWRTIALCAYSSEQGLSYLRMHQTQREVSQEQRT